MLPVLLFRTMEGDTSNNSFATNFGVNFDESVILNSVRNRKKVQDLLNCPVCSCTIRPGGLESHYSLELEKLEKYSSSSKKRKLSSSAGSSSGNLAIPGSSTSFDYPEMEELEVDVNGCVGSEVFQRVHTNRLRRLRARTRRPTSPVQTGSCPVCNNTVAMSRLQRHTLRCLKRTGAQIDEDVPDSSEDDTASIDVENDVDETEAPGGGSFGAEYSWCGEERIRAAALVAPRDLAPPSTTEHSDTPLVVDEDEDTELYGPTQYSPSRIVPDDSAEVNTADTDTGQTGNTAEATNVQGISNGLVEASAETRIKALKEKIKELEATQNGGAEEYKTFLRNQADLLEVSAGPATAATSGYTPSRPSGTWNHNNQHKTKCLICMGPYTSAAVSIQCWHVYCEVCWLDSLKAKKICPQCNAITNVHHLRRIYM